MSMPGAGASVAAAPCAARGVPTPEIHVSVVVACGGPDVDPLVYRLLWNGLAELPGIVLEADRASSLLIVSANVSVARDEANKPFALSLNVVVTRPDHGTPYDYYVGQFVVLGTCRSIERMCEDMTRWFESAVARRYRDAFRMQVS